MVKHNSRRRSVSRRERVAIKRKVGRTRKVGRKRRIDRTRRYRKGNSTRKNLVRTRRNRRVNQSKRTRRNRRTSKPKRQMGGGDAYEFVRDVVPTCINVIGELLQMDINARPGRGVDQAITTVSGIKKLFCIATSQALRIAFYFCCAISGALNRMMGGWPGILANCFMTVAKLCVVAIPTENIGEGGNLQLPYEVQEAAVEALAVLEQRRDSVETAALRAGEGSPYIRILEKEKEIINGRIQYIINTFKRKRTDAALQFAQELKNVFLPLEEDRVGQRRGRDRDRSPTRGRQEERSRSRGRYGGSGWLPDWLSGTSSRNTCDDGLVNRLVNEAENYQTKAMKEAEGYSEEDSEGYRYY